MTHLLQVFLHNIVPIILVAGAGFALQRIFRIEPRPLSITVFNILTPALVFNMLVKNSIPSDGAIRLALVASLVVLSLVLLSGLAGRLLGYSSRLNAALILGATFMNTGNYGLSLNQIALGQIGLAWASIYFITNSIWTNSLGVVVAQAGRQPIRKALIGLLRVPAMYAAFLAFGVRLLHLQIPLPISESVDLLSAATIPVMLLVLGMQIAKAGIPERWDVLGLICGFQLIVAPMIAFLASRLVQLTSPGLEVGIIESAMPTAVLSMIIAIEFDTEPAIVTSAVVATTLLSPLTITPILVLLGVG